MDTLSGSVERITYYNPENGYTVLRLRPEGQKGMDAVPKSSLSFDGLATVVGNLPEVSPGEFLQLQGQWSRHATHGSQFKAEVCEQTLPATLAGIQGYLGSGMIRGIGPKLAERIVGKFKEETFNVIEQTPERLLEVSGIGMDRTARITKAWQEQRQVKEIMVFLHGHGVSTNLAVKIYKTYGDQSLEIVQQNPYQLERDIYGVGFKTADKIARAIGLPVDHPSRIEAGIVFARTEMIHEGHVFVPRETLAARAVELLEVSSDLIAPALDRLAQEDRIRPDMVPLNHKPTEAGKVAEATGAYSSSVIYLTPLYFGEKGVAERLKALVRALSPTRVMNGTLFHDEHLSDEQGSAIEMALTHPVSVLTGGPGTGKTTCLKALINTLESQGMKYALASPTGRAAKRLSEATGHPARTIIRLL
jgi:exodeoxyribonuclease V alpha subunit